MVQILLEGARYFIRRIYCEAMDGGLSDHLAMPTTEISSGIANHFIHLTC